jgi:hypothetical protein
MRFNFHFGLLLILLVSVLPISAQTTDADVSVATSAELNSAANTGNNASAYKMSVYKSPTCGCCQKWVDYMTANGFTNDVIEVENLNPLKAKLGIAGRYRSCHTGIVTTNQGEYVFEGHVPAEYVKQFLDNPPAGAIGLSVPGMPAGSPGMEVGERRDYYQVLVLNADGTNDVFAHVNKPE